MRIPNRLVLGVLAMLLLPAAVWADSAPLQAVGRTLVPKQDTAVRMLSEEVNICIELDPSLLVDAELHML
ncbi:MAG: hypothetical protein AB1497_10175 [Bacillota bacterium]